MSSSVQPQFDTEVARTHHHHRTVSSPASQHFPVSSTQSSSHRRVRRQLSQPRQESTELLLKLAKVRHPDF